MQREKSRKLQDRLAAEATDLLTTKLAPPRLRSALVARQALLARLEAGFERKLTLLSAPAGAGKTTLVSEWLAAGSPRHDLSPVAWVSLDSGDNDPVRFWRYVIAACQVFDGALGRAALLLLRNPQQTPIEGVLTALINDLTRLPTRAILVLEDYHLLTAPQIHAALAFLLDHLPATLHLLLITRSDPPLPLGRLRAQNDLSEFAAADLRFSTEETQAFLQQTLPQPLPAEAIARLAARTEGWVAGLRLLALALQGRQTPQEAEQVLATFSGSHRHILEYLVGEVLNAQPEPIQQFLLQTASLSRLTASLCNAITGRSDSGPILQALERANLFLIPLDGAGEWYRYHALFAEAMQHEARRRLGDSTLHALARQAGQWYEEHGLLTEAVEAAFTAQDAARAAALIEQLGEAHGFYEGYTLRRWVEQIPEAVLRAYPALCLIYANALLYTLDRSAPATRALVEVPLGLAERSWQAEGNERKLGEALAFRSQIAWWQGERTNAFATARQALERLPEDEIMWRGICLLTVGYGELLDGKLSVAARTLLEAQALCAATEQEYGVRAAMMILSAVRARQGELHQAAQLCRQVAAEAGDDLADQGSALLGLAALSLEWNDLEAAEQSLSQALEIASQNAEHIGRQYAEEDLLIPGWILLARVLHARGETAQAHRQLQQVLALGGQRRWPHLQREARAWLAWLALATGDLTTAQRWDETNARQVEEVSVLQQEQEALIGARLLLAQGNAPPALHLLAPWQTDAHAQQRARSELEILVLSALAHARQNDQPQARLALTQALALAQPEGYQRLFLDEGEPLAALLRSCLPALREQPQEMYARSLLRAFAHEGTDQAIAPPGSALLIEPLSQQEQRVLRLLAAGRSNPEIAQELVVSVNTVKTQVQSIFRKLSVSSRREARDTARQLKLV